MAFRLECDGSPPVTDASEADVHRAFDDDAQRGGYIILTAPNGDYVQAAGEGDGPYTLECRTAATAEHLRAVDDYSKEEVRSAFLAFLRGDARWRDERTWEPLEPPAPHETADICAHCGQTASGKHKWMFYQFWVEHEFYCRRCLRIMRVYAAIGGAIATTVIAVILAAWLWLTFWP